MPRTLPVRPPGDGRRTPASPRTGSPRVRRRCSRGAAAALLLAALLPGCTAAEEGPATSAPATTGTSAEDVPPTGEGSAPADAGPPACLSGDIAFAPDGVVAALGSGGGDAGIVSGLRWTLDDVCERFVVDLATAGGSPAATVGRTTVELRPDVGMVRITLPAEVSTSAVSRTVVGGRLVTGAYAVARVEGSLAIDLHLDALGGVEARAFLATSPARIVVDLRPVVGAADVTPPAASAEAVLLEPRSGPASYPLDITGYLAPRVEGATVTLEGAAGAEPIDLTVAESDHLWREYTARAESGPAESVELVVVPVRDGEPGGEVSVGLELR